MKLLYVLLLITLFLFSCSDDSAGTISETDIGIMGKIVTEDGVASSGVAVVALLVTDDTVGVPVDTVTTNPSGVYNFNSLSSGTYRLAGTKKIDTLTYSALVDEFEYDSLSFSDTIYDAGVDTLFAPGAVSGVVKLEGTTYHLGVDVFIPGTSFIAKSDTNGVFVITGIPKGDEYQLAAMFPGYTTAFYPGPEFTIKENDTTKLDSIIELKFDPSQTPPAPTGVMASFDSQTKKVTVVWDSVLHPNWNGFVVFRKDSASTGLEPVQVSGELLLTGNTFSETVSDFDPTKKVTLQYQVKSQDANGNRSLFSESAYIRLEESQSTGKSAIVGVMVSSEGVPLSAVRVVLHRKTTDTGFEIVDTVMTNEAGAYELSGIPSGSYTIEGVIEEHGSSFKHHSGLFMFDSLSSVSTPYNCGIDTLWQSGAVMGQVVLEGATDYIGIMLFIPGTSYSAYTDIQGHFLISDIAKGSYTLNISKDGYNSIVSDSFFVDSGDTTEIAAFFELKQDETLTAPKMITVPSGTIEDSDKRYGFVSSFLIMEHEVTVEMYRLFEDEYMNRLGESKGKHPVASVSWGDAIRYANWLSEQNGLTPCYKLVPGKFKRTDWSDPQNENCKWPHDTLFYEFDTTANGYRLPTADEWQHAASGGDDYDYEYATADGTIDSTKAWNDSRKSPSEVKQFEPNPLGIYDMSCNVWEMVWGMASRSPEGRRNYVAPADSANQHGIKMGDGFYSGEGKYALPITRREEWYDTYRYYYECGFRLARSIKD